MFDSNLEAYCFYRDFEPEAVKVMTFERHYLLYSAKGGIKLEAEDRHWILPPSRAAWIPAGLSIGVEIKQRITCCSVLFDPDFIETDISQCQVLELPSFAKEMILHSRRWGPGLSELSNHAKNFFRTLAGTCEELALTPSNTWIPKGDSEPVQRAIDITSQQLSEKLSFAEIARAACTSERSLARLFGEEAGMTWGQVLRRMRMIKAMEHLSDRDARIANIALDVGYDSLSSFNRAFKDFSGLTPSQYREKYYS